MSDSSHRPPSSRLRQEKARRASAPRRKAGASIRRRCEEVLALLGDAPRRRDLLIEHLHKIQDRYGCLSARASGRARGRDEDGDGRGLRGGDLLSPLRRGERRRDGAARDHGARLRLDRLRARRLARAARRSCRRCSARTSACCTPRASAAARPRRSRSSARIPIPHATGRTVLRRPFNARPRDASRQTDVAITPGPYRLRRLPRRRRLRAGGRLHRGQAERRPTSSR